MIQYIFKQYLLTVFNPRSEAGIYLQIFSLREKKQSIFFMPLEPPRFGQNCQADFGCCEHQWVKESMMAYLLGPGIPEPGLGIPDPGRGMEDRGVGIPPALRGDAALRSEAGEASRKL